MAVSTATNDGQILRYDYSFGDFAVAVSVEADDNNNPNAVGVFNPSGDDSRDVYG